MPNDEDIMAWARRAGQPVYHPTSTCSIGSVVDPLLRGVLLARQRKFPELCGVAHSGAFPFKEKRSPVINDGSDREAAADK